MIPGQTVMYLRCVFFFQKKTPSGPEGVLIVGSSEYYEPMTSACMTSLRSN